MHCFDLNPELWCPKSPLEMEAALVSQTGFYFYLYFRESGWHLGRILYLVKIPGGWINSHVCKTVPQLLLNLELGSLGFGF